jgi:hypothetical protein
MCASVVSAELLAALGVDADVHGLALEGLPVGQLAVQDVEDDLAHLHRVDDGEGLLYPLNFYFSADHLT